MDLGNLEATFEANKTPILAAAGAGVVGLALYAKSKKKTAAADPAAAGVSASAGGQVAGATGGAAYDSSASDLYGAIQPQLESLGGQLTDLSNRLNGQYTTPTPVPDPVTAPPSAGTGTGGGLPSGPSPVPLYSSNGAPMYSPTGNPILKVAGDNAGTWYSGTLSDPSALSYYQNPGVTGSYVAAGGAAQNTVTVQPMAVAQWTKGADGLFHNQWGNTAKGISQYGNPIQ